MPDIEDQWDGDKEKIKEGIREYRRSGSVRPSVSLTTKMEYAFWTGAILAAGTMVVSMYFVDPAENGTLWLFGSLGGIALFAGLALLMRHLPEV